NFREVVVPPPPQLELLLGPGAQSTVPVVSKTPLLKPTDAAPPVKVPAPVALAALRVALLMAIPEPAKAFARAVASLLAETTKALAELAASDMVKAATSALNLENFMVATL